MTMKRAFISFDFDHDEELRNALVGQAKNPDSPFQIADWSVRERFETNWREQVRHRIRRTDLTIVICGEYTHQAKGVAAELTITREERKPYFLLRGRPPQDLPQAGHGAELRPDPRMELGQPEEAHCRTAVAAA